jgi:hypothetical protein
VSEVSVTSCDGCGTVAPPGHSLLLPALDWFAVNSKGSRNEFDACSTSCLLRVARRLAGLPEVDELEVLFRAPAAIPITRSATRKPRPAKRAAS